MGNTSRVAVVAVGAGIVLRIREAMTAPAINDSPIYVELARRMSWADPWEASFREPLWTAAVKASGSVFGYTTGAAQMLSLVVGVAGLLVAVRVVRMVLEGWVAVGVVVLLSLSGQLIREVGYGGRESVALLICAVGLWAATSNPRVLPVLAAVALVVRWEIGVSLFLVVVIGVVGGAVRWRHAAGGVILAVVLAGPFLVNNARAFDDPTFHSNVHATFNRNVEERKVWTDDPMPEDERIHPLLVNPRWHGPVTSWAGFARSLGPVEVAGREVKAVVSVPSSALELPHRWTLLVVVLAAIGVWRHRTYLTVTAAVVTVTGVAGYGILTAFDARLTGYLALPLLLLGGLAVVEDPPRQRGVGGGEQGAAGSGVLRVMEAERHVPAGQIA